MDRKGSFWNILSIPLRMYIVSCQFPRWHIIFKTGPNQLVRLVNCTRLQVPPKRINIFLISKNNNYNKYMHCTYLYQFTLKPKIFKNQSKSVNRRFNLQNCVPELVLAGFEFFFFSIFFINYHNTFWQFHIFYLSMLTALLISLGINGPCNKFNIELKNIRPTQKLARHLYALVMFNCYFNLVYIHIILKVMEWKYMYSYQTLA